MAANILSALERVIYSTFFHAADTDKNGYLTINELAEVTQKCGLNLSPSEIAKTFIAMDTNGDWKISLDEFIEGIHRLSSNKRKVAVLNRELLAIDTSRSGLLSRGAILNVAREKSDITEVDIHNAMELMRITDMTNIDYRKVIINLQNNMK